MVDGNEILSSETDAIVMGPNPDGTFHRATYPLESVGKRNPGDPAGDQRGAAYCPYGAIAQPRMEKSGHRPCCGLITLPAYSGNGRVRS